MLLLALASSNIAGGTKKACATGAVFIGYNVGNIIGPYLFTESDAPSYHKGFKACMGIFAALVALTM